MSLISIKYRKLAEVLPLSSVGMVWVAYSNFSSANVRVGFLGTELITGRLDVQELRNHSISILQFCINANDLKTGQKKSRVPETEEVVKRVSSGPGSGTCPEILGQRRQGLSICGFQTVVLK